MSLFSHPHRRLILMRHGQSAYNAANRFTGLHDPPLTDAGVAEAEAAAEVLRQSNVKVDDIFSSSLQRAIRSADVVRDKLHLHGVQAFSDPALNERDYGQLSGLDKDQARERWGEAKVARWRRAYAEQPPGGESLRDTTARVLPFYLRSILPRLMQSRTVLVVAHGNSLRALMMVLDGLSPQAVENLEAPTGDLFVYELAPDTLVARKMIHPKAGDWIARVVAPPANESRGDFYRRALQEEEDAEEGRPVL
ncbi:2,3-bisphosphoglycerate-dependent phosphoglycerate mutase [Caulobacter sp. FWC2]|uniref:2,3-bisphosphoglycerate-dependent phosphoglycerate mutase n=1 Tax=Caulobacter sp. FWC2 TaxID=69664 RepID=UPI0018ED389E|nr:2,3-bisphosphoglycerate-dependent phosphoglycerate mutase [Caulobacter sp. FWC2]